MLANGVLLLAIFASEPPEVDLSVLDNADGEYIAPGYEITDEWAVDPLEYCDLVHSRQLDLSVNFIPDSAGEFLRITLAGNASPVVLDEGQDVVELPVEYAVDDVYPSPGGRYLLVFAGHQARLVNLDTHSHLQRPLDQAPILMAWVMDDGSHIIRSIVGTAFYDREMTRLANLPIPRSRGFAGSYIPRKTFNGYWPVLRPEGDDDWCLYIYDRTGALYAKTSIWTTNPCSGGCIEIEDDCQIITSPRHLSITTDSLRELVQSYSPSDLVDSPLPAYEMSILDIFPIDRDMGRYISSVLESEEEPDPFLAFELDVSNAKHKIVVTPLVKFVLGECWSSGRIVDVATDSLGSQYILLRLWHTETHRRSRVALCRNGELVFAGGEYDSSEDIMPRVQIEGHADMYDLSSSGDRVAYVSNDMIRCITVSEE